MLEMPFERPQFQNFSGGGRAIPRTPRRLMPTTHTASESSYEMGSSKVFLG